MSDTHALYLLLCLLYLTDCVFWVHRHSTAFVTITERKWRLAFPGAMLGNSQGGLLLASPLPPLPPVFFAHLLPVSLSPTNAYSYIPQVLGPAGRPKQMGLLRPYRDIRSVDVSGKEIRINGEMFVRTQVSRQAAMIAAWISRLVPLNDAQRAAEIRKSLEKGFDVEKIKNLIDEFRKTALPLRILCNGLFLYLFVLSPALVWHFGVTRVLIPLGVGMWLMAIPVLGTFWWLHRALYPNDKEERVGTALKMLLCPPTAVRADDALSAQLLSPYHPLAVASLLLPREAFQRFAKQVILDIRHPIMAELLEKDDTGTELWFRKTLQTIIEEFVKKRGLNTSELLRPPVRRGTFSRAYCPRCESEYVVQEGECTDCTSVRLCVFEPGDPDRTGRM